MAQGMALTIGLNAVNPHHYAGWSGDLSACEADANDMGKIARSKGFTLEMLLTKAATRDNVSRQITQAAQSLKPGDIFLISYSGHGGQLPDLNGDEPDGYDETWCLYDGELVDDEIYSLLGGFQPGVRILVFSDSCYSGDVVKNVYYVAMGRLVPTGEITPAIRYRNMPSQVTSRTYWANRDFYDPILSNPKLKEAKGQVTASVILISGCQDNQLSADGAFNGRFTGTLLQVWNGGKFAEDYRAFHKAIVRRMPPEQTPNYFTTGAIDPTFEIQTPFTI